MTQEQLAERLMISTAAVSKWEARNTYPDITMLLPLAEIFGVTVDNLLGYDEERANADVDNILAEIQRQFVAGRFSEVRELIRKARKKYPHDFRIMNKYMWELAGGSSGSNTESLLNSRDELTQICDCILDGCMQDDLRADAIHMKAKLLHADGDTKAALVLLSRLPAWYAPIAKEQLFDRDTYEFRYWNRKNCYGLMDVMAIKLARTVRFDPILSVSEKMQRMEAIAEAFSDLCGRDDLACFSIGETAIYGVAASMITMECATVEDIVRIREKQFSAMVKMMHLAESDDVLKELIRTTYQSDDLVRWQINRLLTSSHPNFAKLRDEPMYMDMIRKWS